MSQFVSTVANIGRPADNRFRLHYHATFEGSHVTLTTRWKIPHAAVSWLSLALVIAFTTRAAGKLGGPLQLEDEGTFFVGNKIVTTNSARAAAAGAPEPGDISVNGVYVHYRIPVKRRHRWPVVMVHGSGQTGNMFETTPDGREGWATYFVRQGHSVYVVDAAGRGRSGFNGSRINQARAEGNIAAMPDLDFTTHRTAWARSRFGPEPYTWWPDTQFPKEALQQYLAQLVPAAESTLEGGGNNTTSGLAALIDKIGPSVMLVHSLGATYGRALLPIRPGMIKALIDLEGRQACMPDPAGDEIKSSYVPVPFLFVAGGHGYAGEPVCRPFVAAINAAGGNATYLLLPEKGLKGNTHMMMMDRNNLKVADLIVEWIAKNISSRL